MNGLQEYLIPYLGSQLISIVLLVVALKNTRLARLRFAMMF